MAKKKKEKKHEKIRAEIQRMHKADVQYSNMNGGHGEPYMSGKARVYDDLLRFIAGL